MATALHWPISCSEKVRLLRTQLVIRCSVISGHSRVFRVLVAACGEKVQRSMRLIVYAVSRFLMRKYQRQQQLLTDWDTSIITNITWFILTTPLSVDPSSRHRYQLIHPHDSQMIVRPLPPYLYRSEGLFINSTEEHSLVITHWIHDDVDKVVTVRGWCRYSCKCKGGWIDGWMIHGWMRCQTIHNSRPCS